MSVRSTLARAALIACAATMGSIGIAGQAVADSSGSNAPHDSVVGGGLNNPPNLSFAHFSISAFSDPDGSNPSGHVKFQNNSTDPNSSWDGSVYCLKVSGNTATIGVQFTNTKNNFVGSPNPPQYAIVWVVDNGEPTGGQPVDFVKNRQRVDQPSCNEAPPANIGTGPDEHGNVQVHEAP